MQKCPRSRLTSTRRDSLVNLQARHMFEFMHETVRPCSPCDRRSGWAAPSERCAQASWKPQKVTLAEPPPPDLGMLRELAEPILESAAFRRLHGITFLGALSPRFRAGHQTDDGTRAQHSLNVADIAVAVARQLGLSSETQRYAAAWGLLHDVATWPLSHTSEPAFSRVTGVEARRLREMLLVGDSRLPAELAVTPALVEMGVQPNRLLALFRSSIQSESLEMQLLAQVVRSALTPDTLDGMYRTGSAFGVSVPHPSEMLRLFQRNLFEVTVDTAEMDLIQRFWVAKGQIYEGHINTRDSMLRDSRWSSAIEQWLRRTSIGRSLLMTEESVRHAISQFDFSFDGSIDRYKSPLVYVFCKNAASHLVGLHPVSVLTKILLKTRAHTTDDNRSR